MAGTENRVGSVVDEACSLDDAARTDDGKLFHAHGTATENAWSPKADRPLILLRSIDATEGLVHRYHPKDWYY